MFAKAKTSVDTSGLASLSDPLQTIEALSIGIFDPIYDGFRYFTSADGDLFFEANAIATVSYVASSIAAAIGSKQDSDPDLTAIAALTGTTGFLTKTALNTWALDTSTYLTTSSASALYVGLTGAQTVAGVKTFSSNIIAQGTIQIGAGGSQLKNASGIVEVRNAADTAYAQVNASNVRAAGWVWFGGTTGNNVHVYGGSGSGIIELYDSAETGFGRICLGGTGTSHPAIARSGTQIQCTLANASAWTSFASSDHQLGSATGPIINTTGTQVRFRNSANSAYANGEMATCYAANIWFGGAALSNVSMYGPSDGVVTLYNAAQTGFGRIQIGGTSASHPSIKKNGTAINFRLADDSADCTITAGQATFSGLVFVGVYTVATLPSASANTGAFAQVTDSSVTSYGSNVAGGGANRRVVYSNGTNWILS